VTAQVAVTRVVHATVLLELRTIVELAEAGGG
jgi:hypothetical protein